MYPSHFKCIECTWQSLAVAIRRVFGKYYYLCQSVTKYKCFLISINKYIYLKIFNR